MKIELDRKGLEALIKGFEPDYDVFLDPLVKKAGHSYFYSKTYWNNLNDLTDEELYELYQICRNSHDR